MVVVYDIETISNLFLLCTNDIKTNKEYTFVIHKHRNDLLSMMYHLKDHKLQIGFNNISFDSQVLEYIILNYKEWLELDGENISNIIYEFTQSLIEKTNRGEWLVYPEWKLHIKQLDIYKLLHWDSDAKRTSLKYAEFTMDWYNIEEMPFHHSKRIETLEEIEQVISYCLNDVRATKELYKRHIKEVELREELSNIYKMNLLSASEPRLAKEIFAKILSEQMNIEKKELKKMRTFRSTIQIKELILPVVQFKTDKFNTILDQFKRLVITPDSIEDKNISKEKIKFICDFQNIQIDLGLGGIHGFYKEGKIIQPKEDEMLITFDIVSYYPHFNFIYGICPEHLPKELFNPLYKSFFDKRKTIPKSNPINYALKILLNSTYGLTKDKNCFLYDPFVTMFITINGQLLLLMLAEQLSEIKSADIQMLNTDGGEFIINKKDKDLFFEICEKWSKLTGFVLEFDEYSKIIARDINNYLGIYKSNKIKHKGCFEFLDLPLHKNKSSLIIPISLHEYYVNNIPIEQTILNHKNIFDFCLGVKGKGDCKFIALNKQNNIELELQKVNRYYISNKGINLLKRLKPLEGKQISKQIDIFGNVDDGTRESEVEAGWLSTIYNKHEIGKDILHYDLNYQYYIDQCYKIINQIK